MAQLLAAGSLALQLPHRRFIGRHDFRQHFYRDVLPQGSVIRSPDDPHAPTSDDLLQFITVEHRLPRRQAADGFAKVEIVVSHGNSGVES